MSKFERTVILPLVDNEGTSLLSEIQVVLSEILSIAGGYSKYGQEGAWLGDDGLVYTDASIRVVTTVDANQDFALQVRLKAWCSALRQQALYSHVAVVAPTLAS